MFWAHRFGIDVGIIERTWNWNYQQDIDFDTSLDDVDPTIGLTE